MSKIMLINILQPEECRIAILENGVLEELYVERTSHESYVGNIYKGRIVNIEPSIQAAFVDFGVGRNGFLHVSDVEPTYYRDLEPQRHEGRRDDRRGGGRREGGRREGGRRDDRHEGRRDDRRGGRREGGRREEPRRHPIPDVENEPMPMPMPLPRPADSHTAEERRRFAADLLEESDQLPPNELEARPADHVPVEDASGVEEAPAPVTEETPALPETEAAEVEKPKKRTTRRKKEETGTKRTTSRRKKAAPAPEAGEEEPPKPEVMDSAERRTEDGDEPSGPLNPDSTPEEEGLFFRRSRPAPRPEPSRPQSYPVEEPERYTPEPISEPEPRAEESPEEEIPMPPERGGRSRRDEGRRDEGRRDEGRRGGRRSRSIEDDLAADLAAAEVEHSPRQAPPAPAFEEFEQEEPLEQEAVPADEVDVEAMPIELEEEGPGFDPDEELDEMPPPRHDRPDRGGRGDRGDRGGRGDRRGRDRERGGREGGRDRDRRGGPQQRRMGRDGMGHDKPLIQDIFKRGQEVIVQVIKEHLGTKGPTLSTYISIPGRYLVLMPGLNRVGVSRKIQDEEQRHRLKDIFSDLKPPRGVGFIIRTAGEDKSKKELQRDLAYLSRLWQVVVRRIRKQKSPAEIYQESDMITRHIRDTFSGDIDKIIIDEPQAFEQAQEFLQIVMPKYADRIELYEGVEPIFQRHGIEKEIEKIHQKKVPLPNGGSIVIEQTEALVAIDVNSGNFRASGGNSEETAYQINLQAAREIARQLRLRDLAGVIVNDFIDMRDERHRKNVENALRDAVRRDRSRIKVLRMSAFGIIEMTRQRVRTSLKRSVFQECTHCTGSGHVKTPESMSLEVMRYVQLAACKEYVRRVDVTVSEAVANYLHNRKRKELSHLEQIGKMNIQIIGQLTAAPETLHLVCYDNNNNEVKLFPTETPRPTRR